MSDPKKPKKALKKSCRKLTPRKSSVQKEPKNEGGKIQESPEKLKLLRLRLSYKTGKPLEEKREIFSAVSGGGDLDGLAELSFEESRAEPFDPGGIEWSVQVILAAASALAGRYQARELIEFWRQKHQAPAYAQALALRLAETPDPEVAALYADARSAKEAVLFRIELSRRGILPNDQPSIRKHLT